MLIKYKLGNYSFSQDMFLIKSRGHFCGNAKNKKCNGKKDVIFVREWPFKFVGNNN